MPHLVNNDRVALAVGYLPLIVAVVLCGMGVFVLSRNHKAAVNRLFAAGLLTLAGGDAVWFGYAHSSAASSLLLFQRLIVAVNIIMLSSWYFFSLAFGRSEARQRTKRQRRLEWALCAILLVFLFLVPTGAIIEGAMIYYDGSFSFPLGWAGRGLVAVSLALSMAILWNLEMTFRHASRETRQRMKFLVVGLFGILGFHVFWLSRTLLHSVIFADGFGVRVVVHLAASALMLFSLVRHRMLDVDVFVSRHIVYRSLTLLLIGGYLVLLGVGQEAVHTIGFKFGEWTSAAVLVIGGLVLALLLLADGFQRRTKNFIDTHFYKNKYDYRKEWLSLTERLANAVTIEKVCPRIVQGLLETMWAEKAAIYLLDDEKLQFRLVFGSGFGPDDQVLIPDRELLRAMANRPDPIDIQAGRSAFHADARGDLLEALWTRGVRIAAPMVVRDEVLGLLVVGQELSSHPFRPDDYDLCRTVAAQAAAVIMAARLAEDLAQGREIRAFAEMASFLIHDVKNCVHTLSLIASNAEIHIREPGFQQDMIRAIRSSVEKMQGLLRRVAGLSVRAVRLERINLTDVVRGTLRGLAEALPEGVRLETSEEPTVSLIGDCEQLEGVVRNLTMNAIEAIGTEGCITIRTFQDRHEAVLVVADNGRGMSPEFMNRSLFQPFRSTKGGLGLGLYQCKRVTEAHGGRLEVQSVEGQGTTCILRLPIYEGAKQLVTVEGVKVLEGNSLVG